MKARIILRINSPLNKFHRHILPDRIIYRIFCSALFSVEYSNNSGRVIYHPFIPNLETGSAVALTDVFYEVSRRQDLLVLPLPLLAPTALKAIIGAGTYQSDAISFSTQLKNNLCCPDVNTSRHTSNKDIQSVSNCLADFFFQVFFDAAFYAYCIGLN